MSRIVSKSERILSRPGPPRQWPTIEFLLVADEPPLKGTPLELHRCLSMVCAFNNHRKCHYHYEGRSPNRLLLFDPKESEKLPENKASNYPIELKTAEENVRMGPIYQVALEEQQLLKEYLDKIICKGKVRPSTSPIDSPILFVPKPHGNGLRLCVDYQHFNQNRVKDKTPLPVTQ
jgi:hypothetical protein